VWSETIDAFLDVKPALDGAEVGLESTVLQRAEVYEAALKRAVDCIDHHRDGRAIKAIAHRVVHGGSRYTEPVQINGEILTDLHKLARLAPLHQPFALSAIDMLQDAYPGLPQVACFDTAFHGTLPEVERMLPLTWDIWNRDIRRFGFHGLSYEYQSIALAERYGDLARGRTIVAHLGNGASLCGMVELKSRATTMGFSALDGLMMGTRPGAVDPGALLHLMIVEKFSAVALERLLHNGAGLLGISGISSDPRVLLQQESRQPRAQKALAMYVRRIVREIASTAAAVGGLDLLVFTAGVGEHNDILRERICDGLNFIGVSLDRVANQENALTISSKASEIAVVIEPANEEWIVAHHAVGLLGENLKQEARL
jgi:acetate kinase